MSTKQYCCFSAAIRDGATLKPQSHTGIHRDSTCAVGAGVDALGLLSDVLISLSPTSRAYTLLGSMYPYLDSTSQCAACPYTGTLFSLVWHMNDEHNWTREQIADWLYSEEEKLGFETVTTDEEPKTSVASYSNNLTQELVGVFTK